MAPVNRAGGPPADRSVLALLGIFFCSGLAMGYFSPLLSALMNDGGDSELAVGAVSAVFYACAAAGALWAGARRLSIPRSLAAGLAAAGLLGAIAPFAPGVIGLAVARAGCGLAVGIYATVAQAALLARTTERNRAFVTGVQALAFAAGLASGPFVATRIYDHSPVAAFVTGGAVLVLAGLAVLVWMQPEWRGGELVAKPVPGARRGRLPLTAAFVYGFAESVLLSVYPLSLLERNLTIRDVGLSCSAFVFGGVMSVLPVSIAADRLGRARVLLVCAGSGLAALVGLSVAHGSGAVIALSFAVGASLGPMFAIGLALVRDQFSETDLARGTARFMTTFNIGCIAGPVISSIAMTRLGTATVFVPTLVLLALLVVQGSTSPHRSLRGSHVVHA